MAQRFKKWRRVLTRFARNPSLTAKSTWEWFSAPSKTIRQYQRTAYAVRFARNRAQTLKERGKTEQAQWWRKRAEAWSKRKSALKAKMDANAGGHKIIPRSAWDDGPRPNPGAISNESEGLFQHHSVSGAPTTEAGEIAEMRNLKAIALSRGFADISYSWVVFPSGRIYEARGRGVVGAHTLGYNATAHALCAAGNYDAQEPTGSMVDSCLWVRRYLRAVKYRPHYAVSATGCPGRNLARELEL